MISKEMCLKYIDSRIIDERLDQIDQDFLEYEVKMISIEDINRIHNVLTQQDFKFESNPHNSILLYTTGLTDEFDFTQMRSNMIGGAPPDIDIDHDALERDKAIQWCIDYWGREKVSNIITHGTFKPKSLARSYYRITEKDQEDLNDLLKLIPPPKYGKEATLEEILALNPNLSEEERYKTFLEFADRIEDMVANFGIHAAGVIISDKEISDTIPIWKNSKADRITQFDKDECEELGLLKFDFLGIDTISIIKECVSLVKQSKGVEIQPYSLPDGDELAYEKMNQGHLVGVFQMETSGTAKRLILDIKPNSIEDLSAISAINRPGPLQAGLDKTYIANKLSNAPPDTLPSQVAQILKASYWTLIYQEQIMSLFTDLAGFSAQEADEVRRAMGKKKLEVLEPYKEKFITKSQEIGGLVAEYAESLWSDILGFADYCLAGSTEIRIKQLPGKKTIEEIVEDQLHPTVFSYNQGTFIRQTVEQWHYKGVKQTYTYHLDDGSSVTCTPDHKFLTINNQFKTIEEIYTQELELYSTKDIY